MALHVDASELRYLLQRAAWHLFRLPFGVVARYWEEVVAMTAATKL